MELSTNVKIALGVGLAGLSGLVIYLLTKEPQPTTNSNTTPTAATQTGGIVHKAGEVVSTANQAATTAQDVINALSSTKKTEYATMLKDACGSVNIFSNKTDKDNYASCKIRFDEGWAVVNKSFTGDEKWSEAAGTERQDYQVNNVLANFGASAPKVEEENKGKDLVYTYNAY